MDTCIRSKKQFDCFFQLLCHFESERVHAAAMLDLRHRIFPPTFLSENLKEAGFCLRLLHPEPSLRPTTRYWKLFIGAKCEALESYN